MLHMPTPMLLGGEQLSPYQKYLAYIMAQATGGSIAWGALLDGIGSYTTTPDTTSSLGGMAGSSWLTSFKFTDTTVARAMQHGLPSQAVWQGQRVAATPMLLRAIGGYVEENFDSVDRNGFSSSFASGTGFARSVNRILYWAGGQAWQMDPNGGTGPTAFPIP